MRRNNMEEGKGIGIAIVFMVILGLITIVLFAGFDSVDAGHVGVTSTFGKVGETTIEPGLHWTGVWTTTKEMSTQVQRRDYSASAASRDLQTVKTDVTINYRLSPDQAINVYKTIGMNYADVIIFPIAQESVKSATARFTAEELITKRPEVRKIIAEEIESKLSDKGLIVTEVAITNFDFSDSFNAAIEAKQVAEQDASKALNQKRQLVIESEARAEKQMLEADAKAYQVKVEAEGEAYALRIIREELSKSNDLVTYRAVEAWDGALPHIYTGSNSGMLFNLPVGSN